MSKMWEDHERPSPAPRPLFDVYSESASGGEAVTGKTIFIDNRERSGLEKLVMKHAAKAKIACEVQENLLSDYSFGEVGIEAKTMEDFFQSLHSGHLARQLDNMDDNLTRYALVIHGTLDKYVAGIKRRGRKIPYAAIEAQFIGALARFDVDYDVTIMHFPSTSAAARWIVKRCEKDGTVGSSSTRTLRRTASEDVRVDALRAVGCSEAQAKSLLAVFGCIIEISAATKKELMTIDGIGKVRAEAIHTGLTSEQPVVKERVKKGTA